MSDQNKKYYVSVQGLDEPIEISAEDYDRAFNNIGHKLKVVGVQSVKSPEKHYSIIIDKINYFIKKEIQDNQEEIEQPGVVTFK